MTTAIPVSGKIPDFNIEAIKSVDECDDAIGWLSEQITNMSGQIEFRVAKKITDPVWLSRINMAMKKAKMLRQDCYVLRGRMRRAETLERQREIERAFMDAAASVLTPDQMRSVWTEAEGRIGAGRSSSQSGPAD
jgi:hypothetical protein